jgi:hypothetical protein
MNSQLNIVIVPIDIPNGGFDFEHHDSVEAQFGTWKYEILSLTNPQVMNIVINRQG